MKRAVALGPAMCLVVASLVLLGATPSSAASTTYYVDSTAACPGSGTQASPWCNFNGVNSTVFQPGDQVLLKRGDTFTSGMIVSGSGTSSSYVTIGAYGSGAAPIIDGNDTSGAIGINLHNNSYVEVEGLAIEDVPTGILINDTTSQSGFQFLNLYFTGDGEGIQSPSGSTTAIASNILVQDVQANTNQFSCVTNRCLGSALVLGGVSNVVVNRLYSLANCGATNFGLAPGASNVVIENSESIGDGTCDTPGGATANFLNGDTNITFVNDIVDNVPYAGAVDLSGIDVEPDSAPDSGINIEDNYIAGNAGPGIEVLNQPYAITNLNISGNVLSDNGADPSPKSYPVWGQIWTDEWLAGSIEATGSITNNLYNAPTSTGGWEVKHFGANFNGFTQSNNIAVSGAGYVTYAANEFSCTTQGANQWSYQASTDGSTWTNLSGCLWQNFLDQEWSNGSTSSGFVSNFEELPPSTSTSWVARSWTAPSTGGVSVRGRVLMSDPTCASGATAEITKNGSSTPIWGPTAIAAGDNVGVDANLDGVSVNAGDTLHFAVQENGSGQCRVSWTPSVGYPNPVTSVVLPKPAATVGGPTILDASASDSASPISQVQYLLSGGSLSDSVIATVTTPTIYGWIASWQPTNVPTGTYTLQSEVTDAAGNIAYSAPVTITVDNPSTAVSVPSTGSWVSGSQVSLQASATDSLDAVTNVSFELSGGPGSLNDVPVAAATQGASGWVATWDSTTVPDGTYTLQSVATDAAGFQGVSPPTTIIVENSPPTTYILIPSGGGTVSGTAQWLDAAASLNVGVTKVEFTLTGGTLNNAVIASGNSGDYGWLTGWNTTTVPNGTYSLQSEAFDSAGLEGTSAAVTIVVNNPVPTTSVLIPSNGASVAGSQVLLDAGASDSTGVAKVELYLSGGSLNNVLIATATPTLYGWLASWDSTTVPDGTYALESEAFDPVGNVGTSSPITVTVSN